MQRSVYHKYAEVEIEIPNLIDEESEVHQYLIDNEDLYIHKIDDKLSKVECEFGIGISLDDAWTDWSEPSEWRFEIVGKQYGGHL